jgi:hypothetical protein
MRTAKKSWGLNFVRVYGFLGLAHSPGWRSQDGDKRVSWLHGV